MHDLSAGLVAAAAASLTAASWLVDMPKWVQFTTDA
jgi:hypothetical protein